MDLPKPIPCAHDAHFWEAAREGRLMLQRCVTTGKFQWYPRDTSIHANGGAVEWVQSAGAGTVVSFSTMVRSFFPDLTAPYVLAVIRLDEGVQMTAHLVDYNECSPAIGDRVRSHWQELEGQLPRLVFARD